MRQNETKSGAKASLNLMHDYIEKKYPSFFFYIHVDHSETININRLLL
jgi:hypothetical protein